MSVLDVNVTAGFNLICLNSLFVSLLSNELLRKAVEMVIGQSLYHLRLLLKWTHVESLL